MAVILWLSQGIERLNPICWFPIWVNIQYSRPCVFRITIA